MKDAKAPRRRSLWAISTLVIIVLLALNPPCIYRSVGLASAQSSGTPSYKPLAGLGYSPFRDGESPNNNVFPTVSEISNDFANVLQYMTSTIRTYGVDHTLSNIPAICAAYNINCYPCAWIGGSGADISNLNTLIAIANMNYPTTVGLIVGNETMQLGYTNTAGLIGAIDYVRSGTHSNVPITTADTWNTLLDNPEVVSDLDFIMVHVYPYWEGVSITTAAQYVLQRYNQIVASYPGKPVIIGETGWPSDGAVDGNAVPNLTNQSTFLSEFTALAAQSNAPYLYFEAFDETWKIQEGAGSVETNWGIFYSNRTKKPGLINLLSKNLSVLSIAANPTSGVSLTVRTYEGNPYLVYGSTNLSQGAWNGFTNFNGSAGTDRTVIVVPVLNPTGSFYKVGEMF